MEQKQLDDLEDAFFGEEFIEDLEDLPPANNPTKTQEVKIEPREDPELRLHRPTKKTVAASTKKMLHKKSEKSMAKPSKEMMAEEKKTVAEKVVEVKEKKSPELEIKKETATVQVKPAKESVRETKPAVETSSPINPWEDEKEGSGWFTKISSWKTITGLVIVLLLVSLFTHGFTFSEKNTVTGATVATVTLHEAEQKALTYVNTQLLQPPFQATVQSSQELETLYKVTLAVAGQTVDSYVTKDGKLFFPQALNLDAPPAGSNTNKNEAGTAKPAQVMDVSVDDDPALGEANAPVTIIEFSDYQCPFCGKFFTETEGQLRKEYVETGKVKLVYRDFPLEFHPEAEPAALAADCANEQGKFWEYHDLLFTNQAELSDANYKKWAADLGLDTTKFNTCYKKLKYLDEVKKDMADGQKYGVSGTPAFFVNGKMITGAQPYAIFKQEIDTAVSAAGTGDQKQPEVKVQEPAPVVTPEEPTVVPEPTTEPVAAGETVKLTLNAKKWIFDPHEVTVKKGSTVVVTVIPAGLDFTFAVPALGVEKKVSGTTEVQFTADKAGSFDFTCASCEDWRGMKGTLVVQ